MADVLEPIAQSTSIDVYGDLKSRRGTNIAEGELDQVNTLFKVRSEIDNECVHETTYIR